MSELKVSGTITKVLEVEKGVSKATQKEWAKMQFILENKEQYNNLYCFELFGQEKIDNFKKFNKVGQEVDVTFNVSTNEYNGKYYTSLQSWKVFSSKNEPQAASQDGNADDMPF